MTDTDRLLSTLEDKILNLIDERDDYTRSDLQGVVTAIVLQIYKAGKEAK